MHTHKKNIARLVVVGTTLFFPVSALAQNGNDLSTTVMRTTAMMMAFAVTILHFFSWIVFLAANILLDPEFIFNMDSNGQSGLMDLLNQIWMLSRDLMNMGFALLLIVGAVYVLVTDNRDLIKSHIQKFVAVVILVNFSWFIPRVIMDVGNVVTATIYNIPSLINNNGSSTYCSFDAERNWFNACTQNQGPVQPGQPAMSKYSCECVVVTNAEFFLTKQEYANRKNEPGWDCPLGELMCLQGEKLADHTLSGHSYILNGLIVNHGRLLALSSVPVVSGQAGGGQTSPIVTTLFFMMSQALVLLIHIAMFFPLAAMVIAFAIRIPILWMTVAFMPFATLAVISPLPMGKDLGKQIFDNFIKAVFLPALVAVPLTIGFILVNAGTNINSQGLKGVSFQYLQGIGNFYQLIWLIVVLGVIWVGTFAALGKGGIMGKASESIKATGEQIGKFALKAPLSAPIIPGMNVTPLYALKSMRGAMNNIDSNPQGLRGILDGFRNGAHVKADSVRGTAASLKTENVRSLETAIKDLTDMMKKGADAEAINQHISTKINPIIKTEADTSNVRELLETNLVPHLNASIDKSAKNGLQNALDDLQKQQASS